MLLTVCVLIEDHQDNVLAVTRKNDRNKVACPGGKVDPPDFLWTKDIQQEFIEMCERAAARELFEETGLIADALFDIYSNIDEHGNYCVMFKPCNGYTGELKAEPGTELMWLSKKDFLVKTEFPKYYAEVLLADS